MGATFCFILFFIMALIVIAYVIYEAGRKNLIHEKQYERIYLFITHAIDELSVTAENYDYILRLLITLGQMEFTNKEKTSVLTTRFFRKYESIAKERVSEK